MTTKAPATNRFDGLLTTGEAAARLKIRPQQLRQWADAGHVDVIVKPSGHRLFRPEAIDEFAAELDGD